MAGRRVCVRSDRLWAVPLSIDRDVLTLDEKLLASALTVQNSPSDTNDSQYPVAAAIRVYKALFDGLAPCLEGATHIIILTPSDLAAIPLNALLSEVPPKLSDGGYDLSKARWLAFDYAFSNVTSVRDFLSSREIAGRPSGNQLFAGIGDPLVGSLLYPGGLPDATPLQHIGVGGGHTFAELTPLPETRDELRNIAKMLNGPTELLVGASATEERFRALPLNSYQVIHFATHGLIRGSVPQLSPGLLQPLFRWISALLAAAGRGD